VKREHFEILWNACAGEEQGWLSSKDKKAFSSRVWSQLVKERIVGESTIPAEMPLEDYGLEGAAVIRLGDGPDQFWAVPREQGVGGRVDVPRSAVERFPVRLNMLARHLANSWGLDPASTDVQAGFLIGRRKGEILVVVLYEVEAKGINQVRDIRHELGASQLFVIRIGENKLTASERKGLSEDGITFVGTRDFLLPDGTPQWDLDYVGGGRTQSVPHPWGYDSDADSYSFEGKTLPLKDSPKSLLRDLLQNHGEVVPKGQATRSDIYRLKKALPDHAQTWFENVRGQGYRLRRPPIRDA
jgi:hypothetical protein